ncbi:MAG: hypothetical protein JOZ18_23715, partial [Chloroflexi bacterium]|nr:hypothetical protein [Chloroflexota bacterium]
MSEALFPFTLRKITHPPLPPAVLHREALLQQLNDAITGGSCESDKGGSAYKLILLHAPAGYGKTTLLADFTRQAVLPCCWYLLDRSDADKITFLEYLLASVRTQFPFFGSALDLSLAAAADQGAEDSFEALVELFVEALAREIPERFALFLCNYHEVHENAQINTLVNRLLQGVTPCVLVIESRVVPDLAFASLLARREMCVISRERFRLNSEEVTALACLQGLTALDQGEAEHLAAVFDGWMAGILLGTRLGEVRHLAGKTNGVAPLLRGLPASSVDRQFLFAYVVTEVFKDHPDLYDFLKDACVLEEMTPSLCNALLGIADASERLHALEYYGLFVSRSGVPPQETYLCHPVLRDLLAEELRQQEPESFALLHRRAAELLGEAQDYERAITHALSAKIEQMAADLIL